MTAIILAAVLAATPVAPASPDTSTLCADTSVRRTAVDESAQARKLADLPPAFLMHATLRAAGGCDLAEVRFAPGVGGTCASAPRRPQVGRRNSVQSLDQRHRAGWRADLSELMKNVNTSRPVVANSFNCVAHASRPAVS